MVCVLVFIPSKSENNKQDSEEYAVPLRAYALYHGEQFLY